MTTTLSSVIITFPSHNEQLSDNLHKDLIWNNVVSLKLSLFTLRVINKRITTKDD